MKTELEKLQDICREVFEQQDLSIKPDMTGKTVMGWDSFAHVNLFVQIEAKFGVSFEWEEAAEADSLGKVVDMLKSRGVNIDW